MGGQSGQVLVVQIDPTPACGTQRYVEVFPRFENQVPAISVYARSVIDKENSLNVYFETLIIHFILILKLRNKSKSSNGNCLNVKVFDKKFT